jgi:rifampicin phosphotransferase
MTSYILGFWQLGQGQADVAGGKGALLGELSRIDGISVPGGFCVTTDAFRRIVAQAPELAARIELLSALTPEDRDQIRGVSAAIRTGIERAAIPAELASAITSALAGLGPDVACAVRSSATGEDSPGASFAGQHDTYLNVTGPEEVLRHVARCWASLFTERAVTYRLRNGIEPQNAGMAVVVQAMVPAAAAGVLFTADPVTSSRRVTYLEATFGLGEALVSGLVNADVYTVRDGEITSKTIAAKQLAIRAAPAGGTAEQAIVPERQRQPVLTDEQILRLAQLGRRIEAHFGRPQDIEWCLAGGQFQIVQSRPVTTLFPVPPVSDGANHVYLSVGHQQMMTDAMRPLGLSFWQLTTPRRMAEAAGRLFVDVTAQLAAPGTRDGLLQVLGRSDPLMGSALQSVLDRDGFLPEPAGGQEDMPPVIPPPTPIETDPAIVAELIERSEASLAALKRDIAGLSGPALLDFILADLPELRRVLFDPRGLQVILAGMRASWWLNEQLQAWLGEQDAADVLSQSVPGNVTAEMGLALLDVADAIRPHPDVVAFLGQTRDDSFLAELPALAGGREARDAIAAYLDRYGVRCAGEIDITRPRWSEQPTLLLPALLGNVRNFGPGAGPQRFERGRQEALARETELLARLRTLPDGDQKATETRQMIDRVRTFSGYREYPKFGMVSRYFVYKQALLAEAGRLLDAGRLRARDDIFYLTFDELQEVVGGRVLADELVAERQAAYRSYQALTPPRVLTSDGEVITGSYQGAAIPPGALAGLPVSAGTVEGRARVILDIAQADLEPGDILVTAYTDPSWTPLFVAITGLVTEVGGLMTHGAVIAREYGLPAVVGVEGATRLIPDKQRIRVSGTDGFVELLPAG